MEFGMDDGVAALVRNLRGNEPPRSGMRLAAVSVVVSWEGTPSVLLIRRSEHSGDPWSGQIAFPGGKMQPEDKSARDTAIRETLEEAGFDLREGGEFLGYGRLALTHMGSMQVVPAVFLAQHRPEVRLNDEATSFRWVTVDELRSPESKGVYRLRLGGDPAAMPSYQVGDYVVWGLTYRILSDLLEGAPPEGPPTYRRIP